MPKEREKTLDLRLSLRRIIFGTETPQGRYFDICLIICITLSVLLVFLDTIVSIHGAYGNLIIKLEWFFTILFTIEYFTRLYCSANRWQYAKSFYGVVDLLSILPSYLILFFPGANFAMVIRVLRLFRVFRVLKLLRYLSEGNVLLQALTQSSRKVIMFFFSVSLIVVVLGSVMYAVEGPDNGFTSIPKSIYWTIVTITTVGYGDITPVTELGQGIAALTMLIGYSIIAIPTGIISAEISQEMRRNRDLRRCSNCLKSGHDTDAGFCNQCGNELQDVV
ncbi:ion transporter [uncultured Shewanella sp.]|uniref:ion transporter n=1 Tax=uncultured Shewanella sp. TaxID=173975 RepID=UPI002604B79F|nr:ion transporter [uncultured Shewanella sp.]